VKRKKAGRNDGREASRGSQPPPFDRRIIERDLLAVKQLLEEKKFGSVDEMNRYLERIGKAGRMPE